MRRRDLLIATCAVMAGVSQSSEKTPVVGVQVGPGRFGVVALKPGGAIAWFYPTPARVHGLFVHQQSVFVCQRNPGQVVWVCDLSSGQHVDQFRCPVDLTLAGHCLADHEMLYATAQTADGHGKVLCWDRASSVSWQYETAGLYPHELVFDSGGISVANGGDRALAGSAEFESSLIYMTSNGSIEKKVRWPDPANRVSIRHLSAHRGRLAVACQFQGKPDDTPLLGEVSQGQWVNFSVPASQVSGYLGSVHLGSEVVVTSPRSNQWAQGQVNQLVWHGLKDVCAVCDGWIFSGDGTLNSAGVKRQLSISFDNHAAG